jgi:Tfp pilus assembly protein PilV
MSKVYNSSLKRAYKKGGMSMKGFSLVEGLIAILITFCLVQKGF